jgi:hypothetical protein
VAILPALSGLPAGKSRQMSKNINVLIKNTQEKSEKKAG